MKNELEAYYAGFRAAELVKVTVMSLTFLANPVLYLPQRVRVFRSD